MVSDLPLYTIYIMDIGTAFAALTGAALLCPFRADLRSGASLFAPTRHAGSSPTNGSRVPSSDKACRLFPPNGSRSFPPDKARGLFFRRTAPAAMSAGGKRRAGSSPTYGSRSFPPTRHAGSPRRTAPASLPPDKARGLFPDKRLPRSCRRTEKDVRAKKV